MAKLIIPYLEGHDDVHPLINASIGLALLYNNDAYKKLKIKRVEVSQKFIDPVFEKYPMHPIHHIQIHNLNWTWFSKKREDRLKNYAMQASYLSALSCGQSSPQMGHMWHMPSHILAGFMAFKAASVSQEAALRRDHQTAVEYDYMPYELPFYTHNREWLAINWAMIGEYQKATDLMKRNLAVPRHYEFNNVKNDYSMAQTGYINLLQIYEFAGLWEEGLEFLSQEKYKKDLKTKVSEEKKVVAKIAKKAVKKADVKKKKAAKVLKVVKKAVAKKAPTKLKVAKKIAKKTVAKKAA